MSSYRTCVRKTCLETQRVQVLYLTSMLPPLSEYEVALPYFPVASMPHDQHLAALLKLILLT